MKIDKQTLGKAIGICAMSWLAIPVIYYLLKNKEKTQEKEEKVKENDRKE